MTRSAREILIRPLMTEKSMRQKEEQNTVAFKVRPDANKVEIRVAVEAVFNVKVASVRDRKSTRLNSSHGYISYAVFCLKKKKKKRQLSRLDEKRESANMTHGDSLDD